jgi:hypothetical protein
VSKVRLVSLREVVASWRPLDPAPQSELADALPGFRTNFEKPLGKAGSAGVFHAVNLKTGAPVVVKVAHLQSIHDNEVRIARALLGRGCVEFLEEGTIPRPFPKFHLSGLSYSVWKLVPGVSLDCPQGQVLSVEDALTVGLKMLTALSAFPRLRPRSSRPQALERRAQP